MAGQPGGATRGREDRVVAGSAGPVREGVDVVTVTDTRIARLVARGVRAHAQAAVDARKREHAALRRLNAALGEAHAARCALAQCQDAARRSIALALAVPTCAAMLGMACAMFVGR